MNFILLDQFMQTAVESIFPTAVLHIRHQGKIVYERSYGWLDPETRESPTQPDTLFDLASLTKLFTITAFLRLVDRGETELDTAVADILPPFYGKRPIQPYEDPLHPGQFVTVSQAVGEVDASQITFRHLLTHTSGLPAWRPLFRLPPEQIRSNMFGTFFSYPTGTRVIYSDLGLILLGWAIEKVVARPLPAAISHLVSEPLDIPYNQLHFIEIKRLRDFETISQSPDPQIPQSPPDRKSSLSISSPTEFCHWRGRRMQGEAHDENAWALNGVSGHAGLFGTATAVAALGQAWLDILNGDNDLLPRPLAQEAVSLQAEDGLVRRGLGWALWSPAPESASHPLGQSTFGHTGFTGTSLYIDPERELVIVCLTNEVYYGRKNRGIASFRVGLHKKIVT